MVYWEFSLKTNSQILNFYCICLLSPTRNFTMGQRCTYICFALIFTNFSQQKTDAIFLLGDFNCRLGSQRVFCVDDNVRARDVTHQTQNLHGQSFAEFLLDSKLCVQNVRCEEDSNKFTSVSVNGKNVCVPHDQLGNCYNFRIKPCSDEIKLGKLQNFLGSKCVIPDHDILMFDYKCKIEYPEQNQETHIDTKKNSHIPPRKKLKIKQIPTKFVCSDTVKEALREFKTKRIMQGKTN